MNSLLLATLLVLSYAFHAQIPWFWWGLAWTVWMIEVEKFGHMKIKITRE
jgi:hypothetical protein